MSISYEALIMVGLPMSELPESVTYDEVEELGMDIICLDDNSEPTLVGYIFRSTHSVLELSIFDFNGNQELGDLGVKFHAQLGRAPKLFLVSYNY